MFDLTQISLKEMTRCGADLRRLGEPAGGFEQVAGRLVRYFYTNLRDASGGPACALVRLFKTQSYGRLAPSLQQFAQRRYGDAPVQPSQKCFVLMATAGQRPEWNCCSHSVRFQAVPVGGTGFVTQFPMFSQLLGQFGVDLPGPAQPSTSLLVDTQDTSFNVFSVPEAVGSPYILQDEFVRPFGIRSVLGFGASLPSGDLFAVILFTRVPVSVELASLFRTLGLCCKIAVLPCDRIEPVSAGSAGSTSDGQSEEVEGLRVRARAVEHLLDVHEQTVVRQAEQLERTVADLRQQTGELTRSEAVLRDSEAHYRLLFEANPHPMWVYDAETLAFLAVNQATVDHYGYTKEEFLAMTIKDIRPVEDIPSLIDRIARAAGGLEASGMWRHRKQDGSLIDVEIMVDRLLFGGRPAVLVLAHDVTARTRAEQAVRESEEQFMLFMDNLPGFAWIKDAEGHYVYANRYFQSVFRLQSDWQGKTDSQLFPPETAVQFLENDRQVLQTGRDLHTIETFQLQDGCHYGLVRKFPIVRPAGGQIFVGGISIDITERTRAEDAFRASEDRFKAFMDNGPAVAFMKDEAGRYLYVNGPMARFFERAQEQWIGNTDFEMWPQEVAQKFRENDLFVLQGDTVVELEEAAPTEDGILHHWLAFKFPFSDAAGNKVLAGIAIDVTDRKHLEEQLRQAQKMEAIGRLAGGIAHDFNNLLTVISGYSELLQQRLGFDEALRKHAEQIKLAGDRAAALTRQLLAFGRQQARQTVVLDVNGVVRDLMHMLQRVIGEHITLVGSLSLAPVFVMADPGQLEQVLLNLAINARDAMPEGGTLTIETSHVELDPSACEQVGTLAPGFYVQLRVSDTGCGMDEGTQRRIFDPFFTTKDVGKGTGLGLATVYGMVTQSRGAIVVASAPGAGSAFTIYLPACEIAGEPSKASSVEGHTDTTGSETIVLVETQSPVRDFLRHVLRLNGYEVLEATNGRGALTVCRRHRDPIHLLITEATLPDMSSGELAEGVLAEHSAARVLFIPGHGDVVATSVSRLPSGADVLHKPFGPTAFMRKVREILDRH